MVMLAFIAAASALAMLALVSGRAVSHQQTLQGDGLREAVFRLARGTGALTPDSATADALRFDPEAGGFTVVVVAQPSDCDGNLGSFGFLGRRSIQPFVPHRLLLIQGSARDTIGLRFRLPPTLQHAGVELLSDRQRNTLRSLGHYATPALLLFDNTGTLRYAGQVASTPMALTVERDIILRLVTNNPAPPAP